MSKYAYIEGQIIFGSEEKKNQAVRLLEEGGWIEDGQWHDEAGGSHGETLGEDAVIEIPQKVYRNLIHYIKDIYKLAKTYHVAWASNDGDFHAGVISSGGTWTVDLYEWAKANVNESIPTEADFESESEFQENLSLWQESVIEEFLSDPRGV